MHKALSFSLSLSVAISCTTPPTPQSAFHQKHAQTITNADTLHQRIYNSLLAKDSLLFTLGFNQCDTTMVRQLTSHNFEFYHDQAGITDSKDAFVQSIAGLCQMDYKATRQLDKASVEVNLLRENGALYGALQTGTHSFYAEGPGKPRYHTSTAKFIHLWILVDNDWKLKRVISYDHREP